MGERGPVGKRPDQRHGHRTKAEQAHDTVTPGAELVWPAAGSTWRAPARRLYEAARSSGQVAEWQQTDVEACWILCDQIARELGYRHSMSAVMLQAVTGGMNDLLMTVGSRRRAKLELARGESEQARAAQSASDELGARRKRAGA